MDAYIPALKVRGFTLNEIETIKWSDIEALFIALGADIEEREGSRVGVVLFGEVQVYHRPHPQKETDKDAVISIKKWLERNGVKA